MSSWRLFFVLGFLVGGVWLASCSEEGLTFNDDDEDDQSIEDSIAQRQIDDELIDSYIAEKGYTNLDTTNLGVLYTVVDSGGGVAPQLNEIVTVFFIARFLNDSIIDTNIESLADSVGLGKNNVIFDPFTFNYTLDGRLASFNGQYSYLNLLPQLRIAIGSVLGDLREGGRAVIIMPSGTALGPFGFDNSQSSDFVIPPDEVLVFEIILVQVRSN